jgi:hypothetical protein
MAAVIVLATLRASSAEPEIEVVESGGNVRVNWPISQGESGFAVFSLDAGQPLIESLGVAKSGQAEQTIASGLNPVTLLTIGSRDLKNPAGWVAFFDNPPKRPHQTNLVELGQRTSHVTRIGSHVTLSVAEVSAASFRGDLRFTFFRNSPLIWAEVVVSTKEDGLAIVYDTGLATANPDWQTVAWFDTSGNLQRTKLDANAAATSLAVQGRTIVAEATESRGSLAVFPAPHQFFYPQDEAFNLKFVWHGRNYAERFGEYGIGIRQSLEGDKRFVPWFNAPPDTAQHLGAFYLLTHGHARQALDAVAKYTRGDRYKKLPGRLTFTSHYHVEHTLEYLRKQKEQNTTQVPRGLETPGMVTTFKARGVDIVHLAEFHNGETPKLQGDERLLQLKTLHSECARLSDDQLLVLPGEEANVHLGGHWLSFFPKPVYWVLNRPVDKPFVEQVAGFGTVYHVGSTADVLRLMEKEEGLMWTAHPRIKSSIGFPDKYKDSDFFRSEHFLGAAWKAMPADLSRPTLGWRALDLLDDMANWGARKQVLGEADLFRMEPDFETYAHMNINYLELDKLPRFADGWWAVLAALRGGRFFTSTGEVLIPEFSVGGKESGQTLDLSGGAALVLEATLEWTFPLSFAEVVSGDGTQVYRQRIDLAETASFGTQKLKIPLDLRGRIWVRFEVWDVAANGAFTQPVWLSNTEPKP